MLAWVIQPAPLAVRRCLTLNGLRTIGRFVAMTGQESINQTTPPRRADGLYTRMLLRLALNNLFFAIHRG